MSKAEAFVLVDRSGNWLKGPYGVRPEDADERVRNLDREFPSSAPWRWAHLTEWSQCRGITDNRCDYLASCGCICNKCGREHNGMRRLTEQPSPPTPLLASLNDRHGHVVPRADGVKARCGGPAFCRVCQREQASLAVMQGPEWSNLKSDPTLLQCLHEMAARRMSPEERFEQTVSWVWGTIGGDVSKDRVREILSALPAPPQDKLPQDFDEQQGSKGEGNG